MAENLNSLGWSWSAAWNFFKSELAPFPGRGRLVARMTIAATVMMLCIMTFSLPGAALGAYYTLVISRDSTHATVESTVTLLGAISVALVQILVGAILFAGSPLMHFVWVVVSLFSIFFLISAATRYNFATSFGFLVTATIPIWDFPGSTERALSSTLYAALAVTAGAAITVFVEIVFEAVYPIDQIQVGVDERLRVVEAILREVSNPDRATKAQLVQYAVIGTGRLRRLLTRAENGDEDYARKAGVLALAGRLVDLCAGLLASTTPATEDEQRRLIETADHIQEFRLHGGLTETGLEEHIALQPGGGGFVQLLESTVLLMNDALKQPALIQEFTAREETPNPSLLKRDAFTNPEHLKFALRGTVAALICYIAYHLLDWRGLNSAVATCMITALSTTGSSRQKQILRVAGAITGGLFFAITSEVFLLPHMDSIAEFTLLFGAVTIFSAWIATASPRLSYFGLQVAFAFYVVQLRGFSPETQLTPTRDNVMGILLGLIVMWVVFDQLAEHNSLVEMKQNFVRAVRMLAEYMHDREGASKSEYLRRVRRLRDAINESLGSVRSSADAVLFEFDRNREQALKVRADVKAWQPQFRTLFLLQITLAQMRLREPSGHLPAEVERLQEVVAREVEVLADALEHAGVVRTEVIETPLVSQEGVAGSIAADSLTITRDLLQQVRSANIPGA